MRPHRAPRRGQAHHDVVHAPAGEEVELLDEVGGRVHVRVDVLHEHGPVRGRQAAQARGRERPGDDLPRPRAPALHHQPRLDVAARREREQPVRRDGIAEARQRASHEQRPLLPMAAQERAGAQPSEQAGTHAE